MQLVGRSDIEIFERGSITDLYGKWNALVALDKNGEILGCENAHDGDFFPESVFDYIDLIRSSKLNTKSGNETITYPVRVDIDITQKCNSHCSFCFKKKYQAGIYHNQWVPKEVLENLLSQLAALGIKSIRYCGGGEPLLHPEINELLSLPRKFNLKLSIITNGDYMNKEKSKLILKYVDKLHWSLNAATDELRFDLHKSLEGANRIFETQEYIRFIIENRKNKNPNTRKPLVWATYLILHENIKEIVAAAKKMKQLGIDSISYRPVYHGLDGNWSDEEIKKLTGILSEVRTLGNEPSFFVFTPKRSILESPHLNPNLFFRKCISKNVRTIVESSSEGLLLQNCGMYRGAGKKQGQLIAGNAFFEKVWKKFHLSSNRVNAPLDCISCIDISMNVTLNFINDILENDINAVFYCAYMKKCQNYL